MHLAIDDRAALGPVFAHLSAPAASERRNRYARWALHQGLVEGDVVALLMRDQPDVLAIRQGLAVVGVTVLPLDPALRDAALAGRVDAAGPRHLIVEAGLSESLGSVQGRLSAQPVVWWHGGADFARIDLEVEDYDGGPLDPRDLIAGASRA